MSICLLEATQGEESAEVSVIYSPAGRLLGMQKLWSEADEYGFGLEMNVPEFVDALLDVILQSEDVGGGGFPAVHDGQRMFAGDPDLPAAVALAEAGMLDQPGGGNFFLGIESWIAGDLQ